jgi:hypothetical protein
VQQATVHYSDGMRDDREYKAFGTDVTYAAESFTTVGGGIYEGRGDRQARESEGCRAYLVQTSEPPLPIQQTLPRPHGVLEGIRPTGFKV